MADLFLKSQKFKYFHETMFSFYIDLTRLFVNEALMMDRYAPNVRCDFFI